MEKQWFSLPIKHRKIEERLQDLDRTDIYNDDARQNFEQIDVEITQSPFDPSRITAKNRDTIYPFQDYTPGDMMTTDMKTSTNNRSAGIEQLVIWYVNSQRDKNLTVEKKILDEIAEQYGAMLKEEKSTEDVLERIRDNPTEKVYAVIMDHDAKGQPKKYVSASKIIEMTNNLEEMPGIVDVNPPEFDVNANLMRDISQTKEKSVDGIKAGIEHSRLSRLENRKQQLDTLIKSNDSDYNNLMRQIRELGEIGVTYFNSATQSTSAFIDGRDTKAIDLRKPESGSYLLKQIANERQYHELLANMSTTIARNRNSIPMQMR